MEGVLSLNAETLKNFITTYISLGSNVMTDSWAGDNFLYALDSGYTHYTHNRYEGDFRLGIQSTSHFAPLLAVF